MPYGAIVFPVSEAPDQAASTQWAVGMSATSFKEPAKGFFSENVLGELSVGTPSRSSIFVTEAEDGAGPAAGTASSWIGCSRSSSSATNPRISKARNVPEPALEAGPRPAVDGEAGQDKRHWHGLRPGGYAAGATSRVPLGQVLLPCRFASESPIGVFEGTSVNQTKGSDMCRVDGLTNASKDSSTTFCSWPDTSTPTSDLDLGDRKPGPISTPDTSPSERKSAFASNSTDATCTGSESLDASVRKLLTVVKSGDEAGDQDDLLESDPKASGSDSEFAWDVWKARRAARKTNQKSLSLRSMLSSNGSIDSSARPSLTSFKSLPTRRRSKLMGKSNKGNFAVPDIFKDGLTKHAHHAGDSESEEVLRTWS